MNDISAEVTTDLGEESHLNLLCTDAELMGAEIWLIDIDGTLLDTDKLKTVQEAVIEARFGQDVLKFYQTTYKQSRTPDDSIDLDAVIQAVAQNKGINLDQLRSAIYEYDFSLFVNQDRWKQYKEAADAEGAKMLLWSEGCVPYQIKKMDKLGISGHIGSSIHANKVADLPKLAKFLALKGARISRLFDDNPKVIERFRQLDPTKIGTNIEVTQVT